MRHLHLSTIHSRLKQPRQIRRSIGQVDNPPLLLLLLHRCRSRSRASCLALKAEVPDAARHSGQSKLTAGVGPPDEQGHQPLEAASDAAQEKSAKRAYKRRRGASNEGRPEAAQDQPARRRYTRHDVTQEPDSNKASVGEQVRQVRTTPFMLTLVLIVPFLLSHVHIRMATRS